ncbi:hypothetical protein PTSG_09707 [Salpingoeca rosetta]|uniref:Uncharacterized protein n=1 Tax=Salpingoeca rosetta (strain ATCC 50818 / BSB-021) TaxID=946362 RepID=F2UNT6_SALR5|nr:uncharacterized protein PTSG_09707 [Salpingoeca rosetta]EGD79291.1 hypothetical protein PTSG_09707 [Salpingoeca rosetta]|eukprot:XP_004989062.1 hypothetical protein PTSG_09707 [Salpingoeca rosetta]
MPPCLSDLSIASESVVAYAPLTVLLSDAPAGTYNVTLALYASSAVTHVETFALPSFTASKEIVLPCTSVPQSAQYTISVYDLSTSNDPISKQVTVSPPLFQLFLSASSIIARTTDIQATMTFPKCAGAPHYLRVHYDGTTDDQLLHEQEFDDSLSDGGESADVSLTLTIPGSVFYRNGTFHIGLWDSLPFYSFSLARVVKQVSAQWGLFGVSVQSSTVTCNTFNYPVVFPYSAASTGEDDYIEVFTRHDSVVNKTLPFANTAFAGMVSMTCGELTSVLGVSVSGTVRVRYVIVSLPPPSTPPTAAAHAASYVPAQAAFHLDLSLLIADARLTLSPPFPIALEPFTVHCSWDSAPNATSYINIDGTITVNETATTIAHGDSVHVSCQVSVDDVVVLLGPVLRPVCPGSDACTGGVTFLSGTCSLDTVTWTDCPPGTFVRTPPTPTSDRVCGSCDGVTGFSTESNVVLCTLPRECPGVNASMTVPPTPTSDRLCELPPPIAFSALDPIVRIFGFNPLGTPFPPQVTITSDHDIAAITLAPPPPATFKIGTLLATVTDTAGHAAQYAFTASTGSSDGDFRPFPFTLDNALRVRVLEPSPLAEEVAFNITTLASEMLGMYDIVLAGVLRSNTANETHNEVLLASLVPTYSGEGGSAGGEGAGGGGGELAPTHGV